MPKQQRKPKPPRVWHFPHAISLQYQRSMRDYVRTLSANTEAMLIPSVPHITAEAYQHRADAPDGIDPLVVAASVGTPWLERLNRSLNDLLASMDDHSRALWQAAREYGAQTAAFNAQQFHAMVRRALSVDIFKAEPWLIPEMQAWEIENLRLIRSIPAQHVERLQGTIVRAVREGQPTSDVVKEIRAVSDATESRAELISVDQIGSLNGQLTQYRQQGIGVKSYRWTGVLDRRERPLHVAREGQVFRWDQPPSDGHPGMPIRCRCWASAIMPALEDIEGTVVA
jgi:SPP1 gp7 family putative phage head morphogenesis protein